MPGPTGLRVLPSVYAKEELSLFGEDGDFCFVQATNESFVFSQGRWHLFSQSAPAVKTLLMVTPITDGAPGTLPKQAPIEAPTRKIEP